MDNKNDSETGALHAIALVLGLVGIAAVAGSFAMPTMVEPRFDYESFSRVEAVFNLGLLQDQMMVFDAGLATIIVAVILWGVDKLSR